MKNYENDRDFMKKNGKPLDPLWFTCEGVWKWQIIKKCFTCDSIGYENVYYANHVHM